MFFKEAFILTDQQTGAELAEPRKLIRVSVHTKLSTDSFGNNRLPQYTEIKSEGQWAADLIDTRIDFDVAGMTLSGTHVVRVSSGERMVNAHVGVRVYIPHSTEDGKGNTGN